MSLQQLPAVTEENVGTLQVYASLAREISAQVLRITDVKALPSFLILKDVNTSNAPESMRGLNQQGMTYMGKIHEGTLFGLDPGVDAIVLTGFSIEVKAEEYIRSRYTDNPDVALGIAVGDVVANALTAQIADNDDAMRDTVFSQIMNAFVEHLGWDSLQESWATRDIDSIDGRGVEIEHPRIRRRRRR